MRTKASAGRGKHLVPCSIVLHILADGCNLAGKFGAEDRSLRSPQTEHEPHELVTTAQMAVGGGDGRGVDPDQDLGVLWRRRWNLCDLQHIRRAVGGVDNRFHAGSLSDTGWLRTEPVRQVGTDAPQTAATLRGSPLRRGVGQDCFLAMTAV